MPDNTHNPSSQPAYYSAKCRLDQALVERQLCESRSKAQGLIIAGHVLVNDHPVTKAGTSVKAEDTLRVKAQDKFVSRGGLKLEKAIEAFNINLSNIRCMDVGASTGGFTDCMLQYGANEVIAIDVGYGQLDWKLRQDKRVHVFEKTNIRHVEPTTLPFIPDFVSIDVSFISLLKVLPNILHLLEQRQSNTPQSLLALIKPQFEYKDYLNSPSFKGVVSTADEHREILNGVLSAITQTYPHWPISGLDFSPIQGPKGNIEFLLYLQHTTNSVNPVITTHSIESVVDAIITKSYETLTSEK